MAKVGRACVRAQCARGSVCLGTYVHKIECVSVESEREREGGEGGGLGRITCTL